MITSLVIRLDVIQISSAAVGEVQTLSSSFLVSWLNSRPSSWRENQDREYTGHIWRCWYTSWPCLLLTFKVCLFDLLGRTLWNFARVRTGSRVLGQEQCRWAKSREVSQPAKQAGEGPDTRNDLFSPACFALRLSLSSPTALLVSPTTRACSQPRILLCPQREVLTKH